MKKMTNLIAKFQLMLASLLISFTGFAALMPAKAKAMVIPTPATAIVYGDSILYESRIEAAKLFNKKKGWTYYLRTYPGTAVCDWQSTLESDLITYRPTIVTLETMGNTWTECMKDSNGNLPVFGSQAWKDKYRADINKFFATATAAGSKVLYINQLPVFDGATNTAELALTAIGKQEAAKFRGVSISNAPRNSVSNSGKFVWTKKCLGSETVAMGCNLATLQIPVRNPDGLHLCPVSLNNYNFLSGCPIYSSGAVRYGKAIVTATISPPAPLVP
jgi:hypothetical protein